MIARYFDPQLGRFLTQDSYLGQIDEPPSLHRHFYGRANPLRYIDPTGHYSWDQFKGDAKWTGNFIIAGASDFLQHKDERLLKIGAAAVKNAAHLGVQTVANIHDAAVLAAGSTDAPLWSSTAKMSGERMAAGESAASITKDIAADTTANILTAGVYGTTKEQYTAFRDYAQGRASVEQVESRLIDAAGGAVTNLALTAVVLNETTGSYAGPDLGVAAKTVVEHVSQLPGKARAALEGGFDALHEAIGKNDFTTLGRIEPPAAQRGIYPASLSERSAAFKEWRAGGGTEFRRFQGAHTPNARGTTLYNDPAQLRFGRWAERVDSPHGNSALSSKACYLYCVTDAATGARLKYGITGDPLGRYPSSFMRGKEMKILEQGPRLQMLRLERGLVEVDPGPLNREPWAGSRLQELEP